MSLSIEISGLKLKNPLILGSAGYTKTAKGIQSFIRKGFGAVVCKTVTGEPLEGAPTPRVFWYDKEKTMLSGVEALRNPGVDKMSEAIAASRELADEYKCAIIGSVSGNSLEEIADNAAKLYKAGASVIEIDMACPSTGPHLGEKYARLGNYWSQDSEHAISVIKAIKETLKVPVWPKVSFAKLLNEEFIKEVDKKAKPDAYSFIGGSIPCLAIDTDSGKPVLPGNTYLMMEKNIPVCPMVIGPVKASTIYHTAYISYLTDTPLIPSGGLSTGEHIIQAIMAGASAAGICTAVYRDANVLQKILSDLEEYARVKKMGSFTEIRGIVRKYLPGPPKIKVQMVW